MKYALIIGNNKYTDPKLAQLKTPAADSQALAKALEDDKIGAFDKVVSVIDQPETRIRLAISTFLLDKKPDDLVLVYFSGHGVLDDRGRLFLASKDTQINLLKATAIPSSYIAEEMDSCRSKRQILVLDCCHSGAFSRGAKGEQKAMTEATFEGNGYGRVVMTASDSTQYAFEGDQVIGQTNLSLFTHFLLEGLTTGLADTNNDGKISLEEWYDYTYDKVVSQTQNQIPHFWSYNQQGSLIVASNPFLKKRVVELPLELTQALVSTFVGVREEAVKELGRYLQSRDPEIISLAISTLKKMLNDDSRRISSIAEKLLSENLEITDEPESKSITPTTIKHTNRLGSLLTDSINKLLLALSKTKLPKIDWKFPPYVLWGLLGLIALSVLFYALLTLTPKYPVNLFIESGRVTIYSDSILKSPSIFVSPDDTVYYLCEEDVEHESYLIAMSQNDCNSNKTIGWVRARVIIKLFEGDFPTPLPPIDGPTTEPTAILVSASPTPSADFYPIQLFVDSGRVILYNDSGLKTPNGLLQPDRTIYYLCIEDVSSKSYLIAASQQNCAAENTLGWVRASSVITLFPNDFPNKQP